MKPEQLIRDEPAIARFSVHRSALTSPEIFALERERVFNHSWLYVGHAGEIPEKGDYRRRTVAGRPLMFIRGSDGEIRVLYNTCTHRGAEVCRQDAGRANVFQCFYHAWTFDNRGALVGVPDEESYGGHFDRGALGLKPVPRVDSYRDLYFVSYDPDIVDLRTYLGQATKLMDLTFDSAEVLGGYELLAGSAQYTIRANWKLMVENSYDGYHAPPLHATYMDYVSWRAKLRGKDTSGGTTFMPQGATRGVALPHGHGVALMQARGRAIAHPSPFWDDEANAEVERVRAENIARFGERRGREMCEVSRWVGIYPNFIFQDTQSGFRLRLINPVAADLMEVQQWELVPRHESELLRKSRMELSLAFLGPGGFATPDDVEALESCQRGFAAGVEWSDISRGMERAQPTANDELQMRSFWRQWQGDVSGAKGPVSTGDGGRDAAAVLEEGVLAHA